MTIQADHKGRYDQFTWHPFTHLKYAGDPINIVRSQGSYYFDEKGNKYLDAISSWWVNLHGHSHPYIAEKVSAQLRTNAHSIFSGFTHPGAMELSQRLIEKLGPGFSKVFFSDDGSTSVEVALKMALQYWNNKNEKRIKIMAFENAYHGDTFGSMSVGARNVFNRAFSELLFDVERIPLPNEANFNEVLQRLRTLTQAEKIAAFIFEPLVLGAGGMLMYEAKYLDALIHICREHRILCIADEVMTGFGRTGKFFAIDRLKNRPDIICLSKGVTGGVMPLGITACAQFIHEACLQDDRSRTFFHGHSYTGNPVACAAALASLDLMEKHETWDQVELIAVMHEEFAKKIKTHTSVIAVRTTGTILAIEIKSDDTSGYLNPIAEQASEWFLKQGIIVRPLGNVLYVMPPYCIKPDELMHIYSSFEDWSG